MGEWKFLGGKIWKDDHFEANTEFVRTVENEENRSWNLEDDDLLLPGIIDIHAHLWSPAALTPFGVSPDNLYAEGVVGACEPGSIGSTNWLTAQHYWKTCRTSIRSCCHLLPEGFTKFPPTEPTWPENIDAQKVADTIEKVDDGTLFGIKIHLGFLPYKSEETDRATIKLARQVADLTGKKLVVHMSGICMPLEEMISYLHAGDILTHTYSGFEHTILDADGKVYPFVVEAQKRGVIIDIAHAAKHFSWDVFEKAYVQQGFEFDTISSDMTVFSYQKPDTSTLFDLYHVISALLTAGVDLDKAFKAVTKVPSEILNIPLDINSKTLVLKKVPSTMPLKDGLGKELVMAEEYRPVIFCDEKGCILYRV